MIKLTSIEKNFGTTRLFSGISMDFPEDCITAILGPSGCGKTTLLKIIMSLEEMESGEIHRETDTSFSAVFQENRLLPWMTLRENILFVLEEKGNKEEASRALELAGSAGLLDSLEKYPWQLSGGMRQRASLVRAFAYTSDYLIMDEPFSHLDIRTKSRLMNIFSSLWEKDRRGVIMVTHDIDEAVTLADRIYVMDYPPSDSVFFLDISAMEASDPSAREKAFRTIKQKLTS